MNIQELIEEHRREDELRWSKWLIDHNLVRPGQKVTVSIVVNITEEPIAAVKVDIPPELLGEQFGTKRDRYYSRELTPEELNQIATLPWPGWKKGLVNHIVGNLNTSVSAEQLLNAAQTEGRKRGCWQYVLCSAINFFLSQRHLPYRLHAGPETRGRRDKSAGFRFYRKVENT